MMLEEEDTVGRTDVAVSGFSLGCHYALEKKSGLVRFLVMPVEENGRRYFRFPGGTQHGVETPQLTLEREFEEELAKAPTHLRVRYEYDPIHEGTKPDDDDPLGFHRKSGFLVHTIDGEFRDTELVDESTKLGVPEFMEADRLLTLLGAQGQKTRFHFECLVKALRIIMSRSNKAHARYNVAVANCEKLL